MFHVFPAAQLAVGYIEEVTVTDDLPQEIPGFNMHGIITGIAIVKLAMNWDGTVGTDGNAVD
jgi:hypothetical protein